MSDMNNRFLAAGLVAMLAAGLLAAPACAQEVPSTYRMSGGSMKPTVAPDTVLKIEKYPSDWLPMRGNIVAFRFPSDPSTIYFKRLIGLPAEKVQMIAGALHLNGNPLKREQLPDYTDKGPDGKPLKVKRWRETLPNAEVYETLDLMTGSPLDDTPVFDLGPDQFFVIGDNRDSSTDSRVPQVGVIPAEYIVGYAKR